MAYCPHCRRDGMAPSHVDRCPDNPPVHAAIRAVLTDPTNPRYAIGSTRYGMIAATHGVPAEATLVIHYGSWGAAVEAFGLLRANTKPRVSASRTRRAPSDRTAPCCYCGAHYLAGANLDRHKTTCPLRPEIIQAVRALVEDTDAPGIGVDSIVYEQRRTAYNATKPADAPLLPGPRAFIVHFREWPALLHHFGLVTHDEAADAKAAADNARYRAAWQEHHARELDARGVFVGDDDPRKPNYKPPIIHITSRPSYIRTGCRRGISG